MHLEAYKISKDNAAHPKISAESVSVRGLEEIPYLVLEFALYCNFMSQSSLGVGPGSDPAAELVHVTQNRDHKSVVQRPKLGHI